MTGASAAPKQSLADGLNTINDGGHPARRAGVYIMRLSPPAYNLDRASGTSEP